ncbi:FISUMP domain-containing protein [Dysgonomonas sp. BGC7]|uniref:FISUMP domain-containing protein n=1 Tax=Dysgonomonas sp. BGC7 TaxID=1658008 RepID=UPI0006814BEE|nr:FISUMP domain-containing protein [Dysgonomonas sp. BGC7]MBD8388166.1 hypothetical protein [Dysgonomonas sp. BGC7]
MKTSRKQKLLAILAALSMAVPPSYAQVTIGSGIEPEKGALLDLKEQQKSDGTENATKGLMLPRVNLSDLNKLFPMFTGAYDAAEDPKHTGLTVYNLKGCDGIFAKGVYTWTGTEWIQLTNNPVLTGGNPVLTFPPSLIADNYLVRIPSGQDARTALTSAYAPEIAFSGTNQVTGAWANTIGGGLVFTSNPLLPSTLTTSGATTWTTSPLSPLSIWPDAMTAADLTSNPFLSRESALTITGIAGTGGPCPGGTNQPQDITLNQTNYAILPIDASISSPISLFVLRATTLQYSSIWSNVKWQAVATDGTAAWSDILSSYTTAHTGSERHDDGYNDNVFNYTSNPVVLGMKYKTAQITFSDVDGWAKPVTINVMQCQGTEDMSSVTTIADNTATSTTPAPAGWSGKVVKHEAKPGVYEEFYSAEFEAAGRWMTTNLAATAYDGIHHSTDVSGTATSGSGDPRTLYGPTTNSGNPYNTAYWCYPNGGTGGTTPTSYDNLGLLYTWDAATAGKGGSNGRQNTADEGGNNTYAPVQGICPAGWHLPSDYEWTELENEIIRLTTDYANVSRNISPDGTTGLLPQNNMGNRGTTHGQAMKDVCGVNATIPNGLSKYVTQNGFNAMLVGHGDNNDTYGFGGSAYFWSSSSYLAENAWIRGLGSSMNTVNKTGADRRNLLSVRCKKD